MLDSAIEMYEAVLYGINKEKTSSLTPREFELLVNDSQLEWVKNKYHQVEETQKRVDDLRDLKQISNLLPISQNEFQLPIVDNPLVKGLHGYLFMLSAGFKLQYVNSTCGTGISTIFLPSRIMRSDERFAQSRDPFGKPSDKRLFYEIVVDKMILYTGTQSFSTEAEIIYLRHPQDILIISGLQDCELPVEARKEIVDIAIRKYLEITENPRWQSKTADQIHNAIT